MAGRPTDRCLTANGLTPTNWCSRPSQNMCWSLVLFCWSLVLFLLVFGPFSSDNQQTLVGGFTDRQPRTDWLLKLYQLERVNASVVRPSKKELWTYGRRAFCLHQHSYSENDHWWLSRVHRSQFDRRPTLFKAKSFQLIRSNKHSKMQFVPDFTFVTGYLWILMFIFGSGVSWAIVFYFTIL